jgi:hypothetical protein
MASRPAPAALAVALVLVPAAAALGQQDPIKPTFQLDRKKDVRGPLDIVRVAMSTRLSGTLRGELTMRRAWETSDVGPRGSLCLKLYVKAEPDAQAPEYLVCATAPAQGDALEGEVLANRSGGLPRTLGSAVVARPTACTVYFSFQPSLIRRPPRLRFAGESIWRGARCPRATGCADLAPDAPGARDFRLRSSRASG